MDILSWATGVGVEEAPHAEEHGFCGAGFLPGSFLSWSCCTLWVSLASGTDHCAVPLLWYCRCHRKALLMRQHVSVMAIKWYTGSFPVCKFNMSKKDWVISERPEYAVFVHILFSLNCTEFVFLSRLSSFLKKLNLGISSLMYLLSPKDVNCGLVFALHVSHAVLYTVVFTDAF